MTHRMWDSSGRHASYGFCFVLYGPLPAGACSRSILCPSSALHAWSNRSAHDVSKAEMPNFHSRIRGRHVPEDDGVSRIATCLTEEWQGARGGERSSRAPLRPYLDSYIARISERHECVCVSTLTLSIQGSGSTIRTLHTPRWPPDDLGAVRMRRPQPSERERCGHAEFVERGAPECVHVRSGRA